VPDLLTLAGISLVLGLAFETSAIGWDAVNGMLVSMGVAAALVGSLRLRAFLRQHPFEPGA
jgi:hypothetical protein